MTDTINFTNGAFAVFEPEQTSKISRFIPFRFNPETLSRSLSIEQSTSGGDQAGGGDSNDSAEQGSDADSGSLKETFNVLLRFDLAEREEQNRSSENPNLQYGVFPEISALEDLVYPVEGVTSQPSDGSEPVKARGQRPLVLFIWGEKRVVPVKITGMAINETLFNAKLYPIRAEIDVSLEVLGAAESRDNSRVRSSLDFTGANRRKMSKIFLNETAKQSTSVNLPQ